MELIVRQIDCGLPGMDGAMYTLYDKINAVYAPATQWAVRLTLSPQTLTPHTRTYPNPNLPNP
eukprot:1096868-Prymnesium_polylepis.1